MSTTSAPRARSTRATTNFKYNSKRTLGGDKTLVTFRLENDLLKQLAGVGNDLGLSMSATMRHTLRKGLGLPDEDLSKISAKSQPASATPKAKPAAKATAKKATAPKPSTGILRSSGGSDSNVRSIGSAKSAPKPAPKPKAKKAAAKATAAKKSAKTK